MTAIVESDVAGYQNLMTQLLDVKATPSTPVQDAAPKAEDTKPVEPEAPSNTKKYTFKKGEQTFDLDEDVELEMMADKTPIKMTLKELKDRAAGDVAVKNRMHQLAEEKKKVQATLRDFTKLAKENPLKALEYISNKANETDSSFEYNSYLKALADQSEKISKMNESERKAYQLEQKLKETEGDLSQAKQIKYIQDRGGKIMQETGIEQSQFSDLVQQVLDNDQLMDGVSDEAQLMDVVGKFAHEVQSQQYIYDIAKTIDKDLANDSKFLFHMSDVLQENPDLDESDIRDIINEFVAPEQKKKAEMRLSSKQRSPSPSSHSKVNTQDMSDYELLMHQLNEKKAKR